MRTPLQNAEFGDSAHRSSERGKRLARTLLSQKHSPCKLAAAGSQRAPRPSLNRRACGDPAKPPRISTPPQINPSSSGRCGDPALARARAADVAAGAVLGRDRGLHTLVPHQWKAQLHRPQADRPAGRGEEPLPASTKYANTEVPQQDNLSRPPPPAKQRRCTTPHRPRYPLAAHVRCTQPAGGGTMQAAATARCPLRLCHLARRRQGGCTAPAWMGVPWREGCDVIRGGGTGGRGGEQEPARLPG